MTNPTQPRLVVACDGSALGNPGPGAWAWAAQPLNGLNPTVWAAGFMPHTTNNAAELTALISVLDVVPAHIPLTVILDSTYVRDAATKWRHGWKRRGWKTAAGQPVKNVELMQRIDAALGGRDVEFVWVKAHQAAGRGNRLNEFVDAAAQNAARAGRAGGVVNTGPGWPAPS